MRKSLTGGVASLAFVIALAAGCGSDDSPSKSEFLKQGNAICKKSIKAINAAARKTFPPDQPPSKAQITKVVKDTLVPEVQKQIDGLRDLGAPPGDEDKINAFLDEVQSANDKTKADPTLAVGNQDPFKKATQFAKAYGLTACAA